MTTDDLLKQAREIWGDKAMSLAHIVVAMGTVHGDIARQARDVCEGGEVSDQELKKELGNIIFSTIRWCDDLGYSPDECILLAADAQRKYAQKQR